ncbi:MAG: response regulator [Nitrospinaceae bacterium]|jgi:two-component system chemotaxis response regulator CheY|nr:MAG: response regulator [Nitrospinaceae bacterium]
MPKGKILVVDDEEDVRDVIRLHLESAGYNILEAVDGEDAIKSLREEDNMINVGVILCDIRMPKVNGIECIDFLRKEAPGIPVVVVTGYPDTEMAANLMKKGIKDYLVKPVEKSKLLDTVKEIISRGKETNF